MAIMAEQKKSKLYFLFSSRSIPIACILSAAAWLAYNSRITTREKKICIQIKENEYECERARACGFDVKFPPKN